MIDDITAARNRYAAHLEAIKNEKPTDSPYWREEDWSAWIMADAATIARDAVAAPVPTYADPAKVVPENEAKAAAFRAEQRNGDGKPEGTIEALQQCAKMLNTYGPDCFPANEHGQIHFVRAMMESVADEIEAFIANMPQTERTAT